LGIKGELYKHKDRHKNQWNIIKSWEEKTTCLWLTDYSVRMPTSFKGERIVFSKNGARTMGIHMQKNESPGLEECGSSGSAKPKTLNSNMGKREESKQGNM
jgi:hypothetical protein